MASQASGQSNRLAREKSPYLLQHANNPVDWYAWGEEAFFKAKKEDKPIFLSIGYSTCHWCHVMEEESFEDPATAKLLNDYFVPVKVDREERPDIDAVYMSYVTAVTGSGGWPMSVFLTPEQKPFYGGTYFPPQDRWGMPGFPALLKSIAQSWKTRRPEILESAASAVNFLSGPASRSASSQSLSPETLELAYRRFEAGFDEAYGGFGRAPKFPRSHALSMILRHWRRSHDPQALAVVERTLRAMADGGMFDQLEGGFHRYSTDALWRIPHFEKMLYDQALLVQTYLEAFQATSDPEYARVARRTLDYVLSRLTSRDGAFLSAEDADSPDPEVPSRKREGAYYVWKKSEIEKALGADAEAFCRFYGVEPGGNALNDPHNEFTDRNVLYRAHPPENEPEAVARGRKVLSVLRAKRPAPHLDDKVLTDWNALMISAFARASGVLGERRYAEAAQKASHFIESRLRGADGRLLHRWRDGEAAIPANLNDTAFMLSACLDLYEATFESAHLASAKTTADRMLEDFRDEDGGFFLTSRLAEVLISRPKEIYDGAVPSGNSAAALGLLRLGRATGERRYEAAGEAVLAAFSEAVSQDPSNSPAMLAALDFAAGPSREVVIAAQTRDEAVEALLTEVWRPYFPNQVVLLNLSGSLAELAPFAGEKGPVSGKAAAYVCRNRVCALPVTDREALRKQLNEVKTEGTRP